MAGENARGMGVLAEIVEVLVIPGIYFSFAGFLYLYHFLREFGISVLAVDVPIHYLPMYASTVFGRNVLTGLGLAAVILVAIWATGRKGAGVRYLLPLLLLALFPVVAWRSWSVASDSALELRMGRGVKEVELALATEGAAEPPPVAGGEESIAAGRALPDPLWLILETSSTYYLLHQPKSSLPGGGRLPRASVVAVRKDSVNTVTITIADRTAGRTQ